VSAGTPIAARSRHDHVGEGRTLYRLTKLPFWLMQMIGELEVLNDREGAVVAGWVANGIFYAQFVEYLTGPLGMRFASRFEQHLLINSGPVSLYADCASLDSYDLTARDAWTRVMVSQRRLLAPSLFLARTRLVELGLRAIAAMLRPGLIEVVTSQSEFVARLDKAAPDAWRALRNPRAWVPAKNSFFP